MIMGDWVWASHEEADDNSKENESQDSSQKQNKQNLKFYIIMYIWSFKKEICYWYFDKERYQSYGQWFLQIPQQLNFSNWSEHQKLW